MAGSRRAAGLDLAAPPTWRTLVTLAASATLLLACGDGGEGGLEQRDTVGADLVEDTTTPDTNAGPDAPDTADTTPAPGDGDGADLPVPDPDGVDDTAPPPDADAGGEDADAGGEDANDADDADHMARPDFDGDGVPDDEDRCARGVQGWTSTPETDHDGDGCRDEDEDTDDDNDGIPDDEDACPRGLLVGPDHDGDGCRDDEDEDDDGDGIPDELDECPRGATGWTSTPQNDADRDGCRDADEDLDLDGDGVPDDVDVCPGFYDPEQIDYEAPYGPGNGDLCDWCATLTRLGTLELTDPPLSSDMANRFPPMPTNSRKNYIQLEQLSSRYFIGSQLHPGFPGPLRLLRIASESTSAPRACVAYTIVAPTGPTIPLRLEVSAPGALMSDFDGYVHAGTLVFAAGSPATDRDGDGLLDPWNATSYVWEAVRINDLGHGIWTVFRGRTAFSTVRTNVRDGFSQRFNFSYNLSFFGVGGAHVYLTAPVDNQGAPARVRIFVDGALSHDLEVPAIALGTATYLGEYIQSPAMFVLRKRCAITNTHCQSESDCSSGPCVYRTVPNNLQPSSN